MWTRFLESTYEIQPFFTSLGVRHIYSIRQICGYMLAGKLTYVYPFVCCPPSTFLLVQFVRLSSSKAFIGVLFWGGRGSATGLNYFSGNQPLLVSNNIYVFTLRYGFVKKIRHTVRERPQQSYARGGIE